MDADIFVLIMSDQRLDRAIFIALAMGKYAVAFDTGRLDTRRDIAACTYDKGGENSVEGKAERAIVKDGEMFRSTFLTIILIRDNVAKVIFQPRRLAGK